MIIKFGNGNEIILDDIVKDPKAEAIKWLQEYKESLGCDPGSEIQSEEKGASDVTDSTTR